MTHRITHATDADLPYIYSSWLKSFGEGLEQSEGRLPVGYYRGQTKLIDTLLSSTTCRVLVARSPVDDVIIRGYVVADGDQLHWVNVKSMCRRRGVASALLEAAGHPKTYTHTREPGGEWLRRRGMTYDARFFPAPK